MVSPTAGAAWETSTFFWVVNFPPSVGPPNKAEGLLSVFAPPGIRTAASREYWRQLPPNLHWEGKGKISLPSLTMGQVANDVVGRWQVVLEGANYGNPVTLEYTLAKSRCDNAYANRQAACILPEIPGLVTFNTATYPNFSWHVYNAQLSGLPGRYTTTTYLTRLKDDAKTRANGDKACPAAGLPRPIGYSCDEYPFRSTNQGAATTPTPGPARSQPGCQMPDPERTGAAGWSRCFIPTAENSGAGAALGNYYADDHMLQGDPFQVGYLNP